MKKEFNFVSSDGITNINCVSWECENPKGVIQISHGISEYIERYDEFAKYFNELGYIVVGNDSIGHGNSVSVEKGPMYFGGENSYEYLIKDTYTLYNTIREKYIDIPYYMLGFSLGSFVMRCLVIQKQINIDGLILVGSGHNSNIEIQLGKFMCKLELKKHKDNEVTDKINDLAINAHNKKFKNTRTCMDWLCSNEEAIDTYLNDSRIKKDYTIGIFRELLNSMSFACDKKNISKMYKKTPVLFLSGSDDAVGGFTKGVKKTYNMFKKCGVENIDMKLYPNLRHDLFHEKNNKEIFDDIEKWLIQTRK